MEVGNYLPAITAVVYHQAIPCPRNALLLCQLFSHLHHAPDEGFIFNVGEGWDVFSGQDEDMNRGSGLYIPECDYLLILVQDFSRYLPRDNLAEDASHS